jgi:ABC-type multidrug transport system fused ATPase/permease subunit
MPNVSKGQAELRLLPKWWVAYLLRSEGKLFLLSALCKLLWSASALSCAYYFVQTLVGTRDVTFGVYMCFAYLAVMIALSFFAQYLGYLSGQLGSRVKARLAALVAQHALLHAAATERNQSLALTLASSDAHLVFDGAVMFHYLWGAPVEAAAIFALLVDFSRDGGLICAGVASVTILILYILSAIMTRIRGRFNAIQSEQVTMFFEVLQNVRSFRFYGWDTLFLHKLNKLTNQMEKFLMRLALFKSLNLILVSALSQLLCIVMFGTLSKQMGALTPKLAFTALSLFNTLRFALVILPNAARAYSAASSAYIRIRDFLNSDKFVDRRLVSQTAGLVEIENLAVGPNGSILEKWSATPGELWVFEGPVFSYKTTLIEAIAGHYSLPPAATVRLGGRVSYAMQKTWMQQATIRDNIALFTPHSSLLTPHTSHLTPHTSHLTPHTSHLTPHTSHLTPHTSHLTLHALRENIVCCEPWNPERYDRVLHACALKPDIALMLLGDDTPVAEKGVSLSGGQRQRVGLARAAYRIADIYLLDNPVSALDDQTQHHIWTHLIEGVLQSATVIVASSRPVMSCTAVLKLSKNGVCKGDSGITHYNGFVGSSAASKELPPRYWKRGPRVETPGFASSELLFKASERSVTLISQPPGGRMNVTMEEAAVSDVSRQVEAYIRYADEIERQKNPGNKSAFSSIMTLFNGSSRASLRESSREEQLLPMKRPSAQRCPDANKSGTSSSFFEYYEKTHESFRESANKIHSYRDVDTSTARLERNRQTSFKHLIAEDKEAKDQSHRSVDATESSCNTKHGLLRWIESGKIWCWVLVMISYPLSQCMRIASDIFLRYWSENKYDYLSQQRYLEIYSWITGG